MTATAKPQTADCDRLWTETYGDIQRLGPAHFHARRLTRRLLAGLEYRSVLDVGCGPGWNMNWLTAGRDLDAFAGVDISAEAIGRAQRQGLKGDFLVHDVQAGPLAGCWDLVHCGLMIHLVPDDEAALAHLRRNTGRHLVISAMAGDFERYQAWERRLGALRNYRRGELEGKLQRAGFRVRQAVYWGFPFYSPLGRSFQNLSGTGTGTYGWGTRLLAQALTGLYYLNSSRRGDLLIIQAGV
jgi:SAM-dependent methyltransferase